MQTLLVNLLIHLVVALDSELPLILCICFKNPCLLLADYRCNQNWVSITPSLKQQHDIVGYGAITFEDAQSRTQCAVHFNTKHRKHPLLTYWLLEAKCRCAFSKLSEFLGTCSISVE